MAALHESFSGIHAAIQNEDYDEAIKLSEKILAQAPNDSDALKCLVVSLIQNGQFAEALKHTITPSFLFERCYALYREKRYPEALEGLKDAPEADKFLELKAQVFYGMEKFKEAEELYASMVLKRGASANSDLISNLAASCAKTNNTPGVEQIIAKHPTLLQSVYELAFNIGTLYLTNRDFATAEEYLIRAKTICQAELEAQEVSESEIASDLAPIVAQIELLQAAKKASVTPSVENKPTSKTAQPPAPKVPKKSKYEVDPNAPPKPWVEKPKKKVKRKNKPPKNVDPAKAPDPDRWKPKYERAGYKPRRVKGRVDHDQANRGAQGSVSASIINQPKGTLPPASTPAAPSPTPTPVQPVINKPTQAQRGGKKKGKGRR